VTLQPPPGPPPSAYPSADRRRRRARPALILGVALVVVLLVVGTSGTREWWAHRVHDVTRGSHPANFAIGLLVGLLPLIGVALGSLRASGHRRLLRMLVLGAAGFIATFLLSPSISSYATRPHVIDTFNRVAPAYLAGVITAEVAWLAAIIVAVLRFRRWRRGRFPR
jgi:MFS family permease